MFQTKLGNVTSLYQNVAFTLHCCRSLHGSMILNHNPGLKKKSKLAMDPKKVQRQKERQDAKMRKQVIQPPVDPDSIPDPTWFTEERQRPMTVLNEDKAEERILLQKEWSRYQMKKHTEELRIIRDKLKCREDAMRELKKESEFLYAEALKVDKDNFPLFFKGPMETPPVGDYQPPDFVDEK